MESKGNKSWLERSPKWVHTSVFLLMAPLCVPIIILLVLFVVIVAPFFMVAGYFWNRAFWARLKKRGMVKDWPLMASELNNGSSLVVLFYKTPISAILINQPRLAFDPAQQLSTWQDVESRKWNATKDKETNLRTRSQIEEFLKTQRDIELRLLGLLKTEGCFCISPVSTSQLNELSAVAKQQYVVVLLQQPDSYDDDIGVFLERVSRA